MQVLVSKLSFYIPVAAPVGGTGYIQPFGCGCGECTISSIMKGCPQPDDDEEVPILKVNPTHPLAENHSKAKQWKLEQKTREIQKKFDHCFRRTAHFLHAKKVKISKIKDFLALASPQIADELGMFNSINKLLGFLHRERWLSWFNYELLNDLINEFLQGVFSLESYEEALKEYASSRVEEYDGVQFGLPAKPGQNKILLLKIDSEYRKLKVLNDIQPLRSSICQILKQHYTLLYLVTIHCSIITLEFLMPLHLCTNLFPLSQEQLAELARVGVDAMETDDFKATNLIQQKVHNISVVRGVARILEMGGQTREQSRRGVPKFWNRKPRPLIK